jgi:hypothetical protein
VELDATPARTIQSIVAHSQWGKIKVRLDPRAPSTPSLHAEAR